MNIDRIKERFSPEMLAAIQDEVDTFVQDKFTLDDYTINKHLIDSFFVQPLFYATLLNYYTMHEQRSTISLSDIYNDDGISPTKKDSFFLAFANDMNIDTTGLSSEEIVSAIENRLTVSDTQIHSDMMKIVKQYDKAIDGATGVFWSMFRNSPDHMYFTDGKFATAMMYDGFSADIEITDIMSQSITMNDVDKYKNIGNSGRVTNFIDIYVGPKIKKSQFTVTIQDDSVKEVKLGARKWRLIDIPESMRPSMRCSMMEGGYIGFMSRDITIEVQGPFSGTFDAYYYEDDTTQEMDVKSNNPTYSIEFYGLVPVEVTIYVQNMNSISKVSEVFSGVISGSSWRPKISELSRLLLKSGNSIVSTSGEIWINPLVHKEVPMYNNNLAISPKSILSWVDIDNTAIKVSKVVDLETGNDITI
jgi:hypothetical protein